MSYENKNYLIDIDWVAIAFLIFLTITVPTCIYNGNKTEQEIQKTKQLELQLELKCRERDAGELIDG